MPEKRKKQLTVAVTGAGGFLGRRVVEALCADDAVARVVGFDLAPASFDHPKVVVDALDVRDPAIAGRLAGVDVLVHLAFVMDPIKNETLMRDINVNGTQNVLKAAGGAGVGKVVYTSSAVVYGAHPDNRIPLTEDAPLRANLDFSYAAHKLEVEYVLQEIAAEFPQLSMTVFRPAIVFGPGVDNAWSHALELPLLFGVQGHAPPLQFVHPSDVAAAVHFAATGDIPGVFNLAAEGSLSPEEMMSIVDRRRIDIPEPLAFTLLERLWSLGLAEAPAGMLHYVMHPWVLSTGKLSAAGFTCRHSNRTSFVSAVEASRGHMRIGHRRVRRGDLVRGAAAGAGLAGAVLAGRLWRRRTSAVL